MPDLLETDRYIAIIKKLQETGLDINFRDYQYHERTMLHTIAHNVTTERGVEKITQLLALGVKEIQFDADNKLALGLLLQRAEVDLFDHSSHVIGHAYKKAISNEIKNAARATFHHQKRS